METYKGQINEFVDWISGQNSLTGTTIPGVTENNPISGKSIRELILEKLKIPFVTNSSDENKDKIYFFSSEYAKNLWKNYTDNNNPLYDLEKASLLVLYSMDLPATYKITGLNVLNSTRYIIEGNSSSENANLSFELGIVDSLDSPQQDSITLTYNIEDEAGNTTLNQTVPIDTGRLGETITKNVYSNLRSGRNKVTISASCNNLNAKTSTSFYIYLIKFQISSDFSGYYTPVANNAQTIKFNISISRSITNLPISTTISIKEAGQPAQLAVFTGGGTVWNYTGKESSFSKQLEIINSYYPNKKYTMEIRSVMTDLETNQSFNSNILVYQFEKANQTETDNGFINIAYSTSIDSYTTDILSGEIILNATLYVPFVIDWGYYTDIVNGWSQIDVEWYIRTGIDQYVYKPLTTMTVSKGIRPDSLRFISSEAYSYENDNSYVVARGTINNVKYDIAEFPINVILNQISVTEAIGSLKLSAYGKTNSSDTKNLWTDIINNVTTTFSSGVPFDNNCGWNDDSLIMRGLNSYAIINYCPFPQYFDGNAYNLLESGAAFHIDFKPEYVGNEQDAIITIGGNDTTAPRIIITPNSAGFYTGPTPIIKTNFKSGERISLTFIINKVSDTNDSKLVYIVNNGILERAGTLSVSQLYDNSGVIKIGGTKSSVRVYSIRAFRTSIEVKLALSTYMFDNINDAEMLSRNDIYGGLDSIQYSQLLGKQDLIVITTNPNDPKGLTDILNNASLKRNATVNIERYSTDPSKNFTVIGCRIRNHGLSTLSYPITSMKIWFNKSNVFADNGVELVPEFICTAQQHLGLNKNRYIMKDGSIPANKFVLLANYADSSGTHNGSLLRLIQDTWYNAVIDGEYKLRTAPQLFTSGAKITHNNTNLGEDDSWVEGYYNISPTARNKKGESVYNTNWANKTWPEITSVQFPYVIRNAADSFPCTIFYRENESDLTLLGQYVFMDDKKSDFTYGERSIYYTDDISDPFCMKVENSKKDDKSKMVWSNENVLQIEVVYPNSPLTSYVSKTVADSYVVDENDDTIIIPSGTQHSYKDVYYVDGKPVSYYWELHFELIYPDEDDLTGDKFLSNSEFVKTVTPFLDFLEWITDCKLNYSTNTKWWTAGKYSSTLKAFEDTAHDHLDMYKLAAYYIFFLRFGLVDSVERNALLKTYDGQHWHYEPWDMDIALGCANNGVISYNPPLTRDSKKEDGVSYAFAGKTKNQSNTLWDCLEGWKYWAEELVPKVADALFKAGLSYTNAAKMFDEEYVEKWSETLYNESGHYKYIDAASDSKWRLYLNGARTSHRHWWLSKSMNYYDSKWGCGDFTTHSVEFRINKSAGSGSIKILPNSDTYFKSMYGMQGLTLLSTFGEGLYHADPSTPAIIPAEVQLDDKMFCYIFGATAIEELDFTDMLSPTGSSFIDINFAEAYDDVLGASIKSLKLGKATTPNIYVNPNSTTYTSKLAIGDNSIGGTKGKNDALENLEHLDVIGWEGSSKVTSTWLSEILSSTNVDRSNIKSIYAMGCTRQTSFSSSASGNNFTDLRLPDTINEITMNNSSWENLSFWSTTKDGDVATYVNVGIPHTISNMYFRGSTGRNECSWNLVSSWINSIRDEIVVNNQNATSDEIEELLLLLLSTKKLVVDQIYWGTQTPLSYKDLIRLHAFNNNTAIGNLKGYLRIHEDNITSSQLSKLLDMFGVNVFNIGSLTSNLVVDNESSIVRISVSPGEGINITDEGMLLEEGYSAVLSANHFMLTSDASPNVIINNDVVNLITQDENIVLSKLEANTYYWGLTLSETQHNLFITWNTQPPYLNFSKTITGKLQLNTSVGDGTDYVAYVKVYYKDTEGNVQSDEIKVNIKAATYPKSYNINVIDSNNNLGKRFYCTEKIARDIFGSEAFYDLQLRNVYFMGFNGCTYDFSLEPQGTFTAPITNIEYRVYGLDSSDSTDWMSYTDLDDNDSISTYPILHDIYLSYMKNSSKNGIILKVINSPDEIRRYVLASRITIGPRIIYRYTNIMLMKDSTVVISSGEPLANFIKNKYNTDYSYVIPQSEGIYKYLLLGLDGTLDINNYNDNLRLGDSFKYTKYLTEINITNCQLLNRTARDFDLSVMTDLLSLSFSGCGYMDDDVTLDLTNNKKLSAINLTGTNMGLKLSHNNSNLTSISLGKPYYISMIGTGTSSMAVPSLSSISILEGGPDSIKEIYLEYLLENGSICVYKLFDKLFNFSSSTNNIEKLILKQRKDLQENITGSCIDDLYGLTETLNKDYITLEGYINADKTSKRKVNALHTLDENDSPVLTGNTGAWNDLYVTSTLYYFEFKDPIVRLILIDLVYGKDPTEIDVALTSSQWSTNTSTSDPLYQYTMKSGIFQDKQIETFDELRYFSRAGSLGILMFKNCTKLKSVTMPPPVTGYTYEIAWHVFENCNNLESLTLPFINTQYTDSRMLIVSLNLDSRIPSTTKIYVPASMVDIYKAASNWSSYAGNIYPIE